VAANATGTLMAGWLGFLWLQAAGFLDVAIDWVRVAVTSSALAALLGAIYLGMWVRTWPRDSDTRGRKPPATPPSEDG
jgi:hypothetical protein